MAQKIKWAIVTRHQPHDNLTFKYGKKVYDLQEFGKLLAENSDKIHLEDNQHIVIQLARQ